MQDASYHRRIELGASWIAASEDIVVFTGAGISTDSGIPDFRGPDGVWTRRDAGLPPPSWKVPPSLVRPNAGHLAIADLQALGKLRFLISQNVDNLHLASGIQPDRLAELHGNGSLMKCMDCDRRYTREDIGWDEARFGKAYRSSEPVAGQPVCACGGRIISSVVNFGDPMPIREMEEAAEHARACDLFIAAGSSLLVSPANEFPILALRAGARLVIINREPTPIDDHAQLLFREGISQVLPDLVAAARRILATCDRDVDLL
ncbi:MAG: hypothetical protein JXR96_15530 [Deltaproteobacteria bacterium]|nr:hypothetical protein [Deltaproteobacteria bacterium]